MGKFYPYFVSFTAALGGLLFGYEIGIIGTVLAMYSFKDFFGINEHNEADLDGNITLFFLVGCMIGAIIVSYTADILGRKRNIIIGSFFFTVGGLIQSLSPNLGGLYGGRIVGGIGIGTLSVVVPLYISESAPTKIRGLLTSIYQLMITIGIFIANLVNLAIYVTLTDQREWRTALGIQTLPGFLLLCSMFLLPFSPRWLLMQNREDEALNVIAKVNDGSVDDQAIRDVFNDMRDQVELERQIGTAIWPEMFQPGVRNRFFICVLLQFFQQWTGINMVMYYAPELFMGFGFSHDQASTVATTINSIINVVGTLPGMYLIDRMGRKPLLIGGGFMMGLSMGLLTLFTLLAQSNGPQFGYGAALFIFLFVFSFASTWGPVVWVYQSEVFPLRFRAKGTGAATLVNWAMNGVIGKVTPLIIVAIGGYEYLIFAIWGVIMALFVLFFVP